MSTPEEAARAPIRGRKTVATIRVYGDYLDADERPGNINLYEVAAGSVRLLEAGIQESVDEHLGPEFNVHVTVRPGSVELLAMIVLAGSVVMTYGAVRQGLDYVRRDAKTILNRVIESTVGPWDHEFLAAHIILGPAMSKFAQDTTTSAWRQPVLPLLNVLVILALLTLLLVVVLVQVL